MVKPSTMLWMHTLPRRLPLAPSLQVCRRPTGATVKCASGHCTNHFHPLCGRGRGYYLAMRPGSKAGSTSYRAFCGAHSDRERAKDREAAERAAAAAMAGVSAEGVIAAAVGRVERHDSCGRDGMPATAHPAGGRMFISCCKVRKG
jgi:hypothetical protein